MAQLYHFTANKFLEDLYLDNNEILSECVAKYLKNYQIDGVRFLHSHYKKQQGCILNDDFNLGKTLQAVAFLEAVFRGDNNKKCLIIIKEERNIINWKFHLDTFTKFQTKIITKKEDILNENIYITKWNALTKSISLIFFNFDYIIVDDRGGLLSNKICLNYLLKYYTNKISLVIASVDIAVDLKLFHNVLKLCGILAKEYEDLKYFEEKFSLPSFTNNDDRDILEAYFIRREKINNFCKDFRLRRCQYQYEDVLPLTTKGEYEKSLELWKQNNAKLSCSNSMESLKIQQKQQISSAANQNIETFSTIEINKDRNLNEDNLSEKSGNFHYLEDDIQMSPLLFESDPEIDCDNLQNKEGKNVSKSKSAVKSKKLQKKCNLNSNSDFIRTTRSKCSLVTRSKTQKNKYLILSISDSLNKITKPKNKRKSNKKIIKNQINENISVENKKIDKIQPDLSGESKYDFKIDLVNTSCIKNLQNSTEIHLISPKSNQTIILSSSSEKGNEMKSNEINFDINPSIELFSSSDNLSYNDDYKITCSQNHKTTRKNNSKKDKKSKTIKSCYIMLHKKNEIEKSIKESNGDIDETLFIKDDTNILEQKNENKDKYNKITKYLIGVQHRTPSCHEVQHKTPKRQKIQRPQKSSSKKKSPKSNYSGNSTPTNGLTKWLTKSSESSKSKVFIKRRLDISFQNL